VTIVRLVHTQGAGIRAFVAEARGSGEPTPAFDSVGRLERENFELREAIATLRSDAQEQVLAAREQGRIEGAEVAQRDYAVEAAAIAKTAEAAAAGFGGFLSTIEEMSVVIAHAALSKMFDQPERHSEFVGSLIKRQVLELQGQTIVSIHVSGSDFPDEESLRMAARDGGNPDLTVDGDLPAGACLIKLKLGEIDIGLPTQWNALSKLLLETVCAGEKP
jgi:flagellar biosynthesis/type III secretory pathway protein FliH